MIIIVLKMKTTTKPKANHVIKNHLKLCFQMEFQMGSGQVGYPYANWIR